jgi:hypothetical protein
VDETGWVTNTDECLWFSTSVSPCNARQESISTGNGKAMKWAQEQSQIKPRITFVYMPKDTRFAGFRQTLQ